jgi:uncharacterized protein (TIGR02117 family)
MVDRILRHRRRQPKRGRRQQGAILRVGRILGGTVAAIVGAVILYAMAALALGYVPVNRDFQPTPGGTEIFVCSNGWHTDFVLPVRNPVVDWSRRFPAPDFGGPVTGFDHIGLGWGNLDFYRATPRWEDFKLGTALQALTGRGPSALHVQYRPAPGPLERCGRLAISDAQYRALADYIDGSLLNSAAGEAAVLAAPGYGATDAFYLALGRFGPFKSCNVWVDQGLKAAGLPSGSWTPFAFLVLSHLPAAAP